MIKKLIYSLIYLLSRLVENDEQDSFNDEDDYDLRKLRDIEDKSADNIPLHEIDVDEEAAGYSDVWLEGIRDYTHAMAKSRAKICMRNKADISDMYLAYATLTDPSSIINIYKNIWRRMNAEMALGFPESFIFKEFKENKDEEEGGEEE